MHEVINKLFEKFPGVKITHLEVSCDDEFVQFQMGGSGRELWVDSNRQVRELPDFMATSTSAWVEGILKGKTRNEEGDLT